MIMLNHEKYGLLSWACNYYQEIKESQLLSCVARKYGLAKIMKRNMGYENVDSNHLWKITNQND